MKKHSHSSKTVHRAAGHPHKRRSAPVRTSVDSDESEVMTTTLVLTSSDPMMRLPRRAVSFVIFGYEAPDAGLVSLAGTFNDWNPEVTPLTRQSDGLWMTELELPPGRYEYRFLVDGEWHDDPNATELVPNPYGSFNAVITV